MVFINAHDTIALVGFALSVYHELQTGKSYSIVNKEVAVNEVDLQGLRLYS